MTQEITILPTSGPLVGQTMPGPQTNHRQIDLAARAWLHTKSGKSGSLKTLRAYQDTLAAFRAALEAVGLDLDTPDPQRLALVAQVFAGGPEVAPATHNQRVAVLSSFYKFVLLRRLLPGVDANPMELVERRKAQSYARATSLDPADVRNHLGRLDRQTLAGARDYAILLVTLTTGRRVAEIAGLRLKDIKRVGGGKWIELHFRRCKGGKEMRDRLADPVAEALIGYLKLVYPSGSTDPDAPIWISLDQHGGTFGRALRRSSFATALSQAPGRSLPCPPPHLRS